MPELAPIVLSANQPDDRPYRGGAGIARFRGTPQTSAYTPEDFVASTTTVFGTHGLGMTILADGRSLRDAITQDPIGYLGRDHLARFGAHTMLLTKLLDTAERLFVHFHPDDAFARQHLHATTGKTEAWAITAAEPGAHAHLGFSREVSDLEVAQWFRGQDTADMLGAMNQVPLTAGATLLVPAGVPHSIGPGVTLIELQQPADLSIVLEYRGFRGLDASRALLGLSLHEALLGLDHRQWDADDLAVLGSSAPADGHGVQRLFPEIADAFFAAEKVTVSQRHVFDATFAVLVVTAGSGELMWRGGALSLTAGMTALVPYGSGQTEVRGAVEILRCLPPRPR